MNTRMSKEVRATQPGPMTARMTEVTRIKKTVGRWYGRGCFKGHHRQESFIIEANEKDERKGVVEVCRRAILSYKAGLQLRLSCTGERDALEPEGHYKSSIWSGCISN